MLGLISRHVKLGRLDHNSWLDFFFNLFSPPAGTTTRSASLNRLNNKLPLNPEQPGPKGGLEVEQKGAGNGLLFLFF